MLVREEPEPMFEIEKSENYRDKYLRKENDKYVAGLPWKIDHPPLPTNFDVWREEPEPWLDVYHQNF